jgi:chromosome segregation ATPase
VDYEFQIRRLEKELAHLRDIQQLHREHLDAHDKSFEVVGNRMDRIEAGLERFEEGLNRLEKMQEVTEQKFQNLIDLMTRPRGNGNT